MTPDEQGAPRSGPPRDGGSADGRSGPADERGKAEGNGMDDRSAAAGERGTAAGGTGAADGSAGSAGTAGGPGDTADGGHGGDSVMAVVRQWREVRPGIETAPMELIGRLNRCAALLQMAEDAPLRLAGLSRAEFDLLGALRRTGRSMTPGDLARETFSSGAAVTKRVKQLAARGLVERRGDSRDRRVIRIDLTDQGRDLVDGVLPGQLAYEAAALSGLDSGERADLTALLSTLLIQLEGRLGGFRR